MAGFQRPATSPRNNNRQVMVPVLVAIGKSAAVHDHAIVQQRPVTLGDSPELAKEPGKLFDVPLVDFLELVDLGFFIAMV